MQSLGELTTLYPSGGAFTKLADRFVDKAFGVAVGWNYFIIWFAVLANEYNAITSVLVFWSDKVPVWGYFLILWVCAHQSIVPWPFSNQPTVRFFGLSIVGRREIWRGRVLASINQAFGSDGLLPLRRHVSGTESPELQLLRCETNAGHSYAAGGVQGADAIGFRYWRDPGPFVHGFRGVAAVFVFCSTFYAGVESVAVAATETKNPRVAVPMAIRQVFWRILFIYMGSAFFFGLTCPSNADGLVNGGSRALKSPMTVALQTAGWENGVHLINAFLFVTCISAINSSVYIGSRTVLFMAQDGKAPRFLGRTTKKGVPVFAILFTNTCGALSLMNISTGASDAYQYIVNLSGVSTFLVWGSISFIHIRFRKAWEVQGHRVEELPFISALYPWNAYFGLAATIFLALVQGWTTLSPFNAGNFVDAYILLPLFPLIYFGYKLAFRTQYWRIEEIELQSGRRRDLDEDKEAEEGDLGGKQSIWRTLVKSF